MGGLHLILAPSRELLLPPAGANPLDWLAWFTAGKGQRNPSNGKGKRKVSTGTVGKTPRNTTGTTCCCGKNCFGCDCANCTAGTTQQLYFASFSGINFMAAGNCINDGTLSATIGYTIGGTNVSGSGCAQQQATTDCCLWIGSSTTISNNIDGVFGASETEWTNTTCAGGGTTGGNPGASTIYVRRTASGWAAAVSGGVLLSHQFMSFYGTATMSGTNCASIGTLTMSNLLSPGTYNDTIFGWGTIWAVGSGGTLALSFQSSCCP